MNKLKPCPFCGSEKLMLSETAFKVGAYSYPAIVCEECFMAASGPPDLEMVINLWNCRPSESDKVKQLKRNNKMLRKKLGQMKHGKWADSEQYKGYLVCSVCHDCYIDEQWIAGDKWQYCPSCGCRMDLENENDKKENESE